QPKLAEIDEIVCRDRGESRRSGRLGRYRNPRQACSIAAREAHQIFVATRQPIPILWRSNLHAPVIDQKLVFGGSQFIDRITSNLPIALARRRFGGALLRSNGLFASAATEAAGKVNSHKKRQSRHDLILTPRALQASGELRV